MAFGLVDDAGLTPLGEAYHFARFVLQDSDELERVLAQMLKALPEVNALCDALWGKGEVPVQGAVSLIRRTMKTSDDHVAKRWLEMLSKAGLITYNRNRPTLRAAFNPSELAPPGEAAPEVARSHLLSPDTRYSNLLALRDMLRAASGIVRWYETHFDGKVLEVIAREVDNGNVSGVSHIRLMSGPANINRDVKDEYKILRDEMRAKRKIDVEWRVLAKTDARWLHGRFFISGDLARNLPPLNLILGGTLDEISPSEIQPGDFDERWDKATDLAAFILPTRT